MIGIDIKMPKDCAHCPMDQDTYGGGYCLLTNTSTNAVRFVRRSDNCPFVTINDLAEEIKVTNCNHIADDSKMVSSSWPHENGLIDKEQAICALWKALHEYEDEAERQFQESEDLDIGDWELHRIFVQNMSDIDRQTIRNLPSAQPIQKGWICPVCGRGLSPLTMVCPCQNEKGWKITCKT